MDILSAASMVRYIDCGLLGYMILIRWHFYDYYDAIELCLMSVVER